jgi:glutaredoxin
MKVKMNALIIIFVAVLLSISLYYIFFGSGITAGKYDEFAKCLTEKGAKMYGTDWCKYCQMQKELFGSSFKYINFVDCDKNRQECLEAGVNAYPTWRINGKNYVGVQQLVTLSQLSGCELK